MGLPETRLLVHPDDYVTSSLHLSVLSRLGAGRIPFSKLDVLHRHNLERILPRFGLTGLPEETRRALNLAWHKLDVWPEGPFGRRY